MGEINVFFQIDTDNRENFPSGIAFQTFRKQRDSFYEILKIWEENHLLPGWVFQIALGGKIRNMLNLHNDSTNYCHFARLFKCQLLSSCILTRQQEDIADDDTLSFLKNFKNTNPEKLTQLQKRLVTPLPSKNNASGPSFPGTQEFFKDFILHAFNPIFYVHLENCLVHEIIELNDTQFTGSEIEDLETTVDEQTKENFTTCLCSLRLLAKILGLLVSLPYRLDTNVTKEIIAAQVEIRRNVLPSLNLQACIQSAILQGKLSLTIPWIVKYLAMLDIVSLRLPYYNQILELIYYINQAVSNYNLSASDNLMCQQTVLLLKSTLTWLFELPHLPKDMYLNWQKNYKTKELKTLQQINKYCAQACNGLSVDSSISISPFKCTLDKLDIIDDRTIRMCCPSMVDIKISTISKNEAKLNSANSNKHITPVSSQLHKTSIHASMKKLELQLEEAFFHGQPASTRKTVDFVSERVASSCVKYICNTLLSSARERNLIAFRDILKDKYKQKKKKVQKLSNNVSDFKSCLTNEMNVLATKISKELKDECDKTLPTICEDRVTKSIEPLLAEDCLKAVKDMCVKIAIRMATERINQWIQSHILGGILFIKDMELEINRFLRNTSPVHSAQTKQYNPTAPSLTDVIDEIRSLMWDILDNNGKNLTPISLSTNLDRLYQVLNKNSDILFEPERVLYFMSIDFALLLVAHHVDIFTIEIQEKIIETWSLNHIKQAEIDSPILRLLSPRNIMLLAQSENDKVWLVCGQFLRKLIDKNVLNIDALSDQCIALFRHEWPVPVLKHLSKCLTESIVGYEASDDKAEKVKYLLGWIAETCREIDVDDYGLLD